MEKESSEGEEFVKLSEILNEISSYENGLRQEGRGRTCMIGEKKLCEVFGGLGLGGQMDCFRKGEPKNSAYVFYRSEVAFIK